VYHSNCNLREIYYAVRLEAGFLPDPIVDTSLRADKRLLRRESMLVTSREEEDASIIHPSTITRDNVLLDHCVFSAT